MPKRKEQPSSTPSASKKRTTKVTTKEPVLNDIPVAVSLASTTQDPPLPLSTKDPLPTTKTEKIIQLQGHDVALTWEQRIDEKLVDAVLQSVPFVRWQAGINTIENPDLDKPNLYVENIHIQDIDMFGPRVGFSKFKVVAKKWNEKDHKIIEIPGIVFMRGGAVGILCILKDTQDGEEYALTTLQPRIPAASVEFCEIPAGMLDDEKHKFAGKAADEMSEETLLQIKEEELFDLTDMAYKDRFPGMYPSAGGCDEFLRLFLYRRFMSNRAIEALKMAQGGVESEIIKLKLVPVKDLWLESPDSKALSALYLYDRYRERFPDVQPLPADTERETLLIDKIFQGVSGNGEGKGTSNK